MMQFQSVSGEWQFRRAGTKEWLPATVPGGVHTDLRAAGRIPDPFVGDNEKRVLGNALKLLDHSLSRQEKVLADPNHDYTKWLLADVPRLHRKDDILAWANARSR